MRIYAEDNTNYIKSLDTGTEVKLQIIDYDGTPMNLNQFKKVLLKIGKEDLGTILTIEPTILPNGFVKFTIPENTLVKGTYNIEAHMYESIDNVRIAPSNGKFLVIVTKSLDELGNEIAYISVQQLLNDIEKIKKLVEENVGDNLLPIVTANNAVDIATKADLKSDEAKDIANQAKVNVDTANATSEQAKTIANEAKDIANQATDNSNDAIRIATEAKNKAETGIEIATDSNKKSDNATKTAENAKQTAELVRREFDQLTSGNTDAEVIAARTNADNKTFDNLKLRLDEMDSEISSKVSESFNLASFPYIIAATEDNQRIFQIPMKSFQSENDVILIFQNGISLNKNDYTLILDPETVYTNIQLVSSVKKGTTLQLLILKNIPLGEDEVKLVDGNKIKDGSISLNKLAKDLSNVDNTSDLNKPISTATQEKFDTIDDVLKNLNNTDNMKVFESEIHGMRINSNQNLEYYNTTENEWVEIKSGNNFGIENIPNANLTQKGIVQLTNIVGESESLAITQKGLKDAIDSINITKESLGLDKIDNTSDLEKPISVIQQEAITNTLENAKTYTDEKIASIPPTDLTEYEKTINVDSKDSNVLQSAKTYTDNAISEIPKTDLTNLATKSEFNSHADKKASSSEYGHVKVGTGISVNNGVISVTSSQVPDATTATKGIVKLNNSYSTDTTSATTPYAVKLAKDAVDNRASVNLGLDSYTANDNCVAVGAKASVSIGFSSVAMGFRATTSANSATALGPDAKVTGYEGIAIGNGSTAIGSDSVAIAGNANHNWQIMLGGSPNHSVRTEGNWSVGGSKNFEIPHPHPDKQYTHMLRHGTVESPTAGDNLYRYEIEATEDGQTVEFQLPDYFAYLNKDVDVWVNPHLHFGRAYGVVDSDKLKVTCETKGKYKVLVIGTRNDSHVSIQSWNIKGVERQIGESWYGETQIIEIEEFIDIKEISNMEEY